ncbi:MAG TPA: alcohol dehydrogenase, partial [Alcanivorax sp.]|nr:alcohol dehydrogenase [Alcanivorax sp.]
MDDDHQSQAVPGTMKAMVLTGHGGVDKLVYRDDVTLPRPAPGQVLVRVTA